MSSRCAARRPTALLLAAALTLPACAATPYTLGENLEGPHTLRLREGEAQFERGRPNAVLDGVGSWVFGLPSKILLLNRRVDSHHVSQETEEWLREYLAANGLENTKVRVNQYAPGGEWSRLVRNRDVPGFWRYTVGLLTVVFYTILPQRLLGGDNYNPFTNSIHLYSDVPAVAIHEGGHAKDFAAKSRFWRGFYAAARILPLVPLYQEATATSDAIGYTEFLGASEEQKRAYRVLYPAYGTYVGGEASRWVAAPSIGIGFAIQYGPVVPGHIVGWVASGFVQEPEELEEQAPDAVLEETADPEAPAIEVAPESEAAPEQERQLEVEELPAEAPPGDEPVEEDGAEPAPSGPQVDLDAVHEEVGLGVAPGPHDQPGVR